MIKKGRFKMHAMFFLLTNVLICYVLTYLFTCILTDNWKHGQFPVNPRFPLNPEGHSVVRIKDHSVIRDPLNVCLGPDHVPQFLIVPNHVHIADLGDDG